MVGPFQEHQLHGGATSSSSRAKSQPRRLSWLNMGFAPVVWVCWMQAELHHPLRVLVLAQALVTSQGAFLQGGVRHPPVPGAFRADPRRSSSQPTLPEHALAAGALSGMAADAFPRAAAAGIQKPRSRRSLLGRVTTAWEVVVRSTFITMFTITTMATRGEKQENHRLINRRRKRRLMLERQVKLGVSARAAHRGGAAAMKVRWPPTGAVSLNSAPYTILTKEGRQACSAGRVPAN